MSETYDTKGYLIELSDPWSDYNPIRIAAKSAGAAKAEVVMTAREMNHGDFSFKHIKSCRRYPALDGGKPQQWNEP